MSKNGIYQNFYVCEKKKKTWMTQKKTTILIRSAAVNGNVDTKFREIYFTLSKGNDFFYIESVSFSVGWIQPGFPQKKTNEDE